MGNKKNKFMFYIAIAMVFISIISSILFTFLYVNNQMKINSYEELNTNDYVDVNLYLGKWYSIYEFPNEFQNNCECVIAEYELEQDYLNVKNTCQNTNKSIEGKAYILNNISNAELEVDFGFFRKGDYNILYVDDNYQYAIVGSKDRDYLWFLSRTTTIDSKYYDIMINISEKEGYFNDNKELREVLHNCENEN